MKTIADLMREAPLFADMRSDRLALLAGCGRNVQFAEGEVIFREGDAADVFYVLRHGAITLETYVPARGPVTIETLESGEVAGWSWLFPPNEWRFDGRAMSFVRAVEFDGACLRAKLDDDPALGFDLVSRFGQMLQERLRWTRMRLLDVYGDVLAG